MAILTLDRHKNGVWITKLLDIMSQLCENHGGFEYDGEVIKVRPEIFTVESLQMSPFADVVVPSEWLCVINRVSDAASPVEVKVSNILD
jgi:hypothetical protein